MAVWTCPSCGRRVPDRIEACHCGAPRPAAIPPGVPLSAAGAAGRSGALSGPMLPSWKSLPRDIRIGLGLLAALIVGALASLLIPDRGPKLPALLGHVDASPPPGQEVRPSPTVPGRPAPRTPPTRPAAAPVPQEDGG